jgi:menaquinone-dependent protoporphyrinogen IX oxidase
MRVVIAFESMFGNTRLVAESIAAGVVDAGGVADILPVRAVTAASLEHADLFVVGAPTHVHGLPRPSTRKGADDMAHKPGVGFVLEPAAREDGVREWFAGAGLVSTPAAAFDTRMHGPALFTGRASVRIARLLRGHGAPLVARPESFMVSKDNRLDPGEADRARAWGAHLVSSVRVTAGASFAGSE